MSDNKIKPIPEMPVNKEHHVAKNDSVSIPVLHDEYRNLETPTEDSFSFHQAFEELDRIQVEQGTKQINLQEVQKQEVEITEPQSIVTTSEEVEKPIKKTRRTKTLKTK